MLSWAIDDAGLTVEQFASQVGFDSLTIEAWINEEARPTRTALKAIAKALKRSTAFFFLPQPPKIQKTAVFFRRVLSEPPRRPSFEELRGIRRVRSFHRIARWTITQLEWGRTRLPRFTTADDPHRAAASVREQLEVSVDDQLRWSSDTDAWNAWKFALERQQIAVMRLSLGKDAIRGFALNDEVVPTIAINTSHKWKTQRIFTLAHELGHLSLHRSNAGQVALKPSSLKTTSAEERWCNQFAAALLMPDESLINSLRSLNLTPEQLSGDVQRIADVASTLGVSVRAVALRMIEKGWLNEDYYDEVDAWAEISDAKSQFGRSSRPRTREVIRVEEFGWLFSTALIAGRDYHLFSDEDLASFTRVHVEELPALVQEVLEVGARDSH